MRRERALELNVHSDIDDNESRWWIVRVLHAPREDRRRTYSMRLNERLGTLLAGTYPV
jgi:hypothetical protein